MALALSAGKNEVRAQSAPSPDPVPSLGSHQVPHRLPAGSLPKQHSYLLTLARERGLTKREVDALCQERFGVVVDHITRSEASLLIEELTKQVTPPQAQQPEPAAP